MKSSMWRSCFRAYSRTSDSRSTPPRCGRPSRLRVPRACRRRPPGPSRFARFVMLLFAPKPKRSQLGGAESLGDPQADGGRRALGRVPLPVHGVLPEEGALPSIRRRVRGCPECRPGIAADHTVSALRVRIPGGAIGRRADVVPEKTVRQPFADTGEEVLNAELRHAVEVRPASHVLPFRFARETIGPTRTVAEPPGVGLGVVPSQAPGSAVVVPPAAAGASAAPPREPA